MRRQESSKLLKEYEHPKMKRHIVKILQLCVSVGIFIIIFSRFDLDIKSTLELCNWRYLLLACCFRLIVSPCISMNRWKTFLHYTGIDESFFSLLKISMKSAFLGIVLPSSQGQDVMRMYYIEKKHPKKLMTSSSTVIVERMVGFLLLAFMGLLFSLLVSFPQKGKVILIIGLINVFLWAGLFVFLNDKVFSKVHSFFEKRKNRKRIGGILDFIDRTYYSISHFPYKKSFVLSTTLILLYQLSTVFVVFLVFKAFGVNLPFSEHLAFYPIIAILSVIPVTISGLGLRESFFVFFYSFVGVAPDVAVTVSLVNYCVEVVLYALLGGVVFLIDSFRSLK